MIDSFTNLNLYAKWAIDNSNLSSPFTNKFPIASGENHYIYVNDLGRVYSWGENNNGQLGNSTTKSISLPLEITERINVSNNDKIVSGYFY